MEHEQKRIIEGADGHHNAARYPECKTDLTARPHLRVEGQCLAPNLCALKGAEAQQVRHPACLNP